MTKTMKQLYNIYTLRWHDPSTDYQGSATCPQSVSYRSIHLYRQRQRQRNNYTIYIYILRWNDPSTDYQGSATCPQSVSYRSIHLYSLCQCLSRIPQTCPSTSTYHSSVWSANAAHLLRYSDVVSWSRSYPSIPFMSFARTVFS